MSWPIVPLGEVAEIRRGVPPPEGPSHGLSSVTDRAEPLPDDAVLISSRGRVGGATVAGAPAETQRGVIGLVPGKAIDPRFLARCLTHFREQTATLCGPGVLGEITEAALGRFPIPLPPLAEQRRIAGVLDRADRLRQLNARVLAAIDRFLPALFLDCFGDPALNPKSCPTARLGELCEVVGGSSEGPQDRARAQRTSEHSAPLAGAAARRGADVGGEHAAMSIAEPRQARATVTDLPLDGDWVFTNRFRTGSREAGAALEAPAGTVLLALRPPIGRAAVTDVSVRIGSGVLGLVCGSRIDPWYLFAWCRVRGRLLEFLGSGAYLREAPRQAIADLAVPAPPVGDQRRFRAALEKLRLLRLSALTAEERRQDLARLLALRAFARTATGIEARDRLTHRNASTADRNETPDRAAIVDKSSRQSGPGMPSRPSAPRTVG